MVGTEGDELVAAGDAAEGAMPQGLLVAPFPYELHGSEISRD